MERRVVMGGRRMRNEAGTSMTKRAAKVQQSDFKVSEDTIYQ